MNIELSENTMTKSGRVLYQVRAVSDFWGVSKGAMGGYVESLDSLKNGAWVDKGSVVFREASIHDGEIHGGDIYGGTIHGGYIYGGTIRGGTIHDGYIYGGEITGGTIYGGSIYGGTIHDGLIHGGEINNGEIHGGVIHGGHIHGGVIAGGNIYGGYIYDGYIYDGDIYRGEIHGGVIETENHIGFSNVGSKNAYLFAYVIDNQITISRGCFHGSIDEFYDKVERVHGSNKHGVLYKALRPIIEMKLNEFTKGE